MYNKCRWGNILIAAAKQGLHFEKLLKYFRENIDKNLLEKLEMWLAESDTDCPERINLLFEQYGNYSQKTMTDGHGKNGKILNDLYEHILL